MGTKRTYFAAFLLLLFVCYYSGISMFSHVHMIDGVSVVHSHLGGTSDHSHSDSQYAVIDILSNFQSEQAFDFCSAGTPFFPLVGTSCGEYETSYLGEQLSVSDLRGPPQA